MADHIRIVSHDPRWIDEFERERVGLQDALAERAIAIEHIGSTSVAGLAAKPLIDIMVAIDDLSRAEEVFVPLAELGYGREEQGDFPGRLFFKKLSAAGGTVAHLSLTEAGGGYWCDQLAFRDALRADSSLARRYADLKRSLAAKFGEDGAAYTRAKTGFVRQALLDAGHAPRSGWAGEPAATSTQRPARHGTSL
jgi:GrpB-like predicted nucleotidyltransferase (UPF0157 family)